jgi:hypothetical protein
MTSDHLEWKFSIPSRAEDNQGEAILRLSMIWWTATVYLPKDKIALTMNFTNQWPTGCLGHGRDGCELQHGRQ